MQVSKGRHKDRSEHRRSSKCTTPCAASDRTGWWDSTPRSIAGDMDPLPSPRARAFYKFSVKLLNVGHQDTRGGGGLVPAGLSEPIYVSHPQQRASDTARCDGQRQQYLSDPLKGKQEESRKPCLAVSLARSHFASLLVDSR